MTITLTPRTEPPNTPDRERRSLSATDCRMEWREEGDTLTLTGYACVFDVPYEMYGGPPWGWTEQFARGAFSKTLAEKPDVQLRLRPDHGAAPLRRERRQLHLLGLGPQRLTLPTPDFFASLSLGPLPPRQTRLAQQGHRQPSSAHVRMSPTWRMRALRRSLSPACEHLRRTPPPPGFPP